MSLIVLLLVGWLAAGLVTLVLLALLFRGAHLDDEVAGPARPADEARKVGPRPRHAVPALPGQRDGDRSLLQL